MTMQSIADDLNLSKTTVSLILKGDGDKYRISAKTQERVLQHAEAIGFTPDYVARALVRKRTCSIGIIFPDLHEAFMSEMLKGIERVMYEADYTLMVSTSGFSTVTEKRNIKQLLNRRVDGVIMVPYIPLNLSGYDHSYMDTLKKANCPIVFADRIPPDHESLNYVIQDDYNAALNAVKYLHQKGCSNLGCVSFDLFASSIQNRLGGFKDGLKACGLAFEPDNMMLLKEQNHDSEDLYTLLKNASQQRPPIDGLVVTTEGLAHKIGFLLSNTDLELRDLAIVKFGKDPKYFKTGMTEIVQPNVEMGRIAAANLLGLINNYITSPVQIKLESKLIQE